ncbi:hypothetical protein ABZY09_26595 [Streptomyces sp. NPDC002928]|uniref:hypothetical protein n=1 Tax=Streptomyces sp. NPDC002928 TaxID=3154440 RepID=UPI0033AA09A1
MGGQTAARPDGRLLGAGSVPQRLSDLQILARGAQVARHHADVPVRVADVRGQLFTQILNVQSGPVPVLIIKAGRPVLDQEEYQREAEPSVPAGLAELTGPQRALADFLRVPQDLLAVAASDSAPATESAAAPDRLAAFIAGLPAPEKDTLLLQAALGTAPQLGPGLLARFRQSLRTSEGGPGVRRSAAQLLDAAHRHRTVRAQRERAARGAAEQARARAVAEARDARLDHLARDQTTAWRTVDDLIAQRKPAAYDQAVALLSDLRALHARQGSAADFDRRSGELRTAHRGKPSLMRRFDALGFPNP